MAERLALRLCVCDFCQSYPLRCLPCLSTHSTYVLLSYPVFLCSLLIIIYFVVSFLPVFRAIINVGGMCVCVAECPLCYTSVLSDVFISINTHINTHTCLFHSAAKLSSKGCLISSVAQAPRVPVGWRYKE